MDNEQTEQVKQKTPKQIRLEGTKDLQLGFDASMRKRRINFFARVFSMKPMSNSLACPLLGMHPKSLSAYNSLAKRSGGDMSVKTKFLYRAVKNLRPEIVSFILNDENFNSRHQLKKNIRDDMVEALLGGE